MLVTGTYLLFKNLIIWLVTKLKSNKNYYYKTSNFLSTSQIVYHIKANSNILCLISLLSALTITLMSATIAMYNALNDSMPVYAPFSYLCENLDSRTTDHIISTAKSDPQAGLKSVTKYQVATTRTVVRKLWIIVNRAKNIKNGNRKCCV